MTTVEDSFTELLQPLVGEPLVAAQAFQSSRAHSLAVIVLRLGQRAAGTGGLNAQIGPGSNLIAITATRVVLVRRPGREPYVVFGDWPRDSVSGAAVRKHLTDNGRRGGHNFNQWMLRTTLQTPDGPVTFDLDEERGGRDTLAALGVPLPELKPKTWWRSQPFD
jgi:hypothetical protein